jgi:hypothetical protein
MPTKPDPTSVIGLLHRVVDDPARTRHAAYLLLAGGVAITLVLTVILLIVFLCGTAGAATVSGLGVLTTVSAVMRRVRRR